MMSNGWSLFDSYTMPYVSTLMFILFSIKFAIIMFFANERVLKYYLFLFTAVLYVINSSSFGYFYSILLFEIFVLISIISVIFFYRVKMPYCWAYTSLKDNNDYSSLFRILFYSYVFCIFFSLIYPDFKLHRIINPPRVDLAAVLDARFYNVQTISPITKIVGYIKMLLFPFAFCYAARLGLTKFIFIVFTYIYVNYVSDGYISRGEIVSWIIILSMVSIFIYDVSIKKIALISSLLFIPMVIFFQAYTKLRLGGDFETVGFIEALLSIIESQSQVSLDGVDLIASGYSFAILDYLKWLFTLPIPKVILPDLGVVNISHSASSDLLGLSPNDKGFFVLLPGYIAESVYIFGLEFYWLSAVVSSLIFVFIIRFLSSNECSYPFVFYIFVVFSYNLSRAGVTSSYPIVLNQLLLMYLFLLYRQVKR